MGRKRRGRGEGTVYRRKDGTWSAELVVGRREDGRSIKRTVYHPTKQGVLDKLHELQVKFRTGTILEGGDAALRSVMGVWLTSLQGEMTDLSFDVVMNQTRYIEKYLGHVPLLKLTPLDIMSWYSRMEEDGVSPYTRRLAGKRLRQFLRRCVHLGVIPINVASRVPLPRDPKGPRPIWTPDQIRHFLESNRTQLRWFPLWVLSLDSGCRIGELLALTWDDVDLDRGVLSITKTLSQRDYQFRIKSPKTAAGVRQVMIGTPTIEVLRDYRTRSTSPLVFSTKHGSYLAYATVYKCGWVRAVERSGLPYVHLHDLRHMSATYLLAAGENPKVVQERLGHENVETTLSLYTHALPSMQRDAAVRMGTFLGSVLPRTAPVNNGKHPDGDSGMTLEV